VEDHAAYAVREMMYGTREVYEYFYCSGCETLQISDIPPDASRFYPRDYSSFTPMNGAMVYLKGRRLNWALFGESWLGALLSHVVGPANNAYFLRSLRGFRSGRILDVGCGKGALLREMHQAGFSRLEGADPFIDRTVDYGGFQVKKRFLSDASDPYDVIMMHHSLEHVPDMAASLQAAMRSLRPEGRLVVRMPVLGEVWERYGTDWIQLDAPRHFHLMTVKGFQQFAERQGWSVVEWGCDSSDLQFWGSEQYRANIPLNDEKSYALRPERSLFSKKKIRAFQKEAHALNAAGRGDSAYFILRPTHAG